MARDRYDRGLVVTARGGSEDRSSCGGPLVVAGLGFGLYLWGTIDSIATAPAAARRHNEQAQSLSIVPVIQPDRSGVMLVGRF